MTETTAFQYDEPASDNGTGIDNSQEEASSDSVLSMVNNGPSLAESNMAEPEMMEGEPDEEVDDEPDSDVDDASSSQEEEFYSDEEFAELCRLADEDHALELQHLETEYAEAGVACDQISDDLKDAKKAVKLALEKIRQHLADGPDYPEKKKPRTPQQNPSLAESSSDGIPAKSHDGTSVPLPDPEALVGETPEHEAYYQTPTDSLLADIEGLGTKKLASLVAVAPTVRELVALQIQAGRGHHGDLSEVLPHGFGKSLGERINEKLLAAMPFSPKTPKTRDDAGVVA